MRKFRFYDPIDLVVGNEVALSETVSHHLSRVLRMKIGEQCFVFDGNGGEALCEITAVDKKSTQVKIINLIDSDLESSVKTHLAQALCKGDKMDWIIQKAVELGVNEITPVLTEHCDVKLDEKRIEKKMQHWQGVLISACEQCGRNVLPVLHQPKLISEFIGQLPKEPSKLIFTPTATSPLKEVTGDNFVLLIGPEGGLCDVEVQLAVENGFAKTSLGKRILRTETAAIASLAVLQVSN